MNSIIFPEDVINVIESFLAVNNGDDATELLLISVGAQLLDVSEDMFMEMLHNGK